jgi:hypothetical protein
MMSETLRDLMKSPQRGGKLDTAAVLECEKQCRCESSLDILYGDPQWR